MAGVAGDWDWEIAGVGPRSLGGIVMRSEDEEAGDGVVDS
jgi:hypothetical protein